MPIVDLNIDLGELADEPRDLYVYATVANIACGGHAGDQASMARALSLCLTKGTRPAAHPSYPDRERFGRVTVSMPPEDLAKSVEAQCKALQVLARKLGYPVGAVKPHGALYHDVRADIALAGALLDGSARGLDAPGLTVVGPPTGALLEAARERGLAYQREGFADRAYRPDGTLVARTAPGALLTDAGVCVRQAIALATSGTIDTLCVHGDTPGALAIAKAVRDGLLGAGLLRGLV